MIHRLSEHAAKRLRGFRGLREIYNETRDPAVVVTAYIDDTVKDL